VDKTTELKNRTKRFAVEVILFASALPESKKFNNISNQLIRSASSVAANYRAACRGRSKAEFLAKLGIVEEEADETLFWLELLEELQGVTPNTTKMKKEADEILSIMVASIRTARK
jgi:four helix bundle protein